MKIYGTVKIIRKDEETPSNTYLEVYFQEFREDGTLKRTGTEDFSAKRWSSMPTRYVWTWDGHSLNKGGHRKYSYEGSYRTDDSKAFSKVIKQHFHKLGCLSVDVRSR